MSYVSQSWFRKLTTASTVAAFAALAQAADEPAPPRPEHAALFKKLDADGDGQITKEEIPEEQRRLLERLISNHDGNKDGKLSASELSAGLSEDRPRGDAPAPGGPGGMRRPDGGQFNPEEFFKRLDRNSDGKVTVDEMPEDRRENFKQMLSRVDDNKDGAASLDEFKKGFGGPRPGEPGRPNNPQPGQPGQPPRPGEPNRPGEPGRPGMPQGGGDPLVRALDTDRNGELSADEIAGASEALKKLDRNGDGKVTREEVGPPMPAGGFQPDQERAMAYFKQMDKDGDGKLSKDEAPERMRENFARIDANSDGKIDDVELRHMMGRGPGGPDARRPEGRPNPEGRPAPEGDRKPEGRPENRPEGRPDRRPDGDRKPEGDAKPDAAKKPGDAKRPQDGVPKKE